MKSQGLSSLPHIAVAFWLLYVGISVWQFAASSVQPPIYDSLNYLQKAMNFWQAIENRQIFNPLNLEPSVRPPGSILMSYPFGFSPNFHGFHFRSVFLPILLIVSAVYLVAGGMRPRPKAWCVATIAVLFSSLPMFYHFDLSQDIPGPSRWGLVDNFQSGVAAMAMAAVIRSIEMQSLRWLLLGVLLAAFTLFIKPSGIMVMGLTGLIWLILVVVERRRQSRRNPADPVIKKYVFTGIAFFVGVYLLAAAPCFWSRYLSSANLDFAKRALEIMNDVLRVDLYATILVLHMSVGVAFLVWLIGVMILWGRAFLANNHGRLFSRSKAAAFLLSSLLIWSMGVWYWMDVQKGGAEIRYFYPFLLMGAICLLPPTFYLISCAPKTFKYFLVVVSVIPCLNMGILLAAGPDPPLFWQKISGVNVSVGRDREEVNQAYDLLHNIRKANESPIVYSFSDGVGPFVFESVGLYEVTVRPGLPTFGIIRPLDWLRGFAVRIDELLDSADYILIRKYHDENAVDFLSRKAFESFELEQKAFQIWLSTLGEADGVKTASEGPTLRLLRIVERPMLDRAVEAFVADHSWRTDFLHANPLRWCTVDALSASDIAWAIEGIEFSGIYKIHALSINRLENGIGIDVWWEELKHEKANRQRSLFFHLTDSSGNVLYNQHVALYPYDPPDEKRTCRHSCATFYVQLPNPRIAFLAFGIYQSNNTFLLPDKGETDWDGQRILIPLEKYTGPDRENALFTAEEGEPQRFPS